MSILVGLIGLLIILIILQDAFETVILPRRVSRRIRVTRLFYFTTWGIWSLPAHKMESLDRRETFLSYYGPLSLILLLALWAVILVLGFAMLQWAFGSAMNARGPITFGTDLYMSGTTFFTLGLGDVTPVSGIARFLTVLEGGIGFGFLALVIGYLPVIYQSFSRREVGISMMDAHAGSPPSAVELLRRHKSGEVMSELIDHLHTWENWAADILESHLSYPLLIFYRSQHDRESWLATLTTILDVCALLIVGIDDVPAQSAWFTFAIATHASVDLAQAYTDPEETPRFNRLPQEDFARLREQLAAVGIVLRDEETAQQRLSDLRKQYEPYVMALARRLMMPLPGFLAEEQGPDDWQTSAWNHQTNHESEVAV
jgi:hypothetical protein